MKGQSLSIEIPEPCHEKWSEMTQTEQGRHCKSCQKTVVDFTKMSKSGVVDYISTNKGQMCGRFSSDQLNVNLLPPKRNRFFSKWAAVFIGIIPFAGYGQVHNLELIENHTNENLKIGEITMVEKSSPISKDGILTGKLLDAETAEPLLFATVVLSQNGTTVRGVETDMDGKFMLDIKGGDIVSYSYIGYEAVDMKVSEIRKITSEMELSLNMVSRTLGMIEIVELKVPSVKGLIQCYNTVEAQKESWLKRQWNKFKSLLVTSHDEAVKNRDISRSLRGEEDIFLEEVDRDLESIAVGIKAQESPHISVYPNPTMGLITIDTPNEFTNGILQIVDVNNQLVFAQFLSESKYQYDASLLVSGTYVVSVISEDDLLASEIFVKM